MALFTADAVVAHALTDCIYLCSALVLGTERGIKNTTWSRLVSVLLLPVKHNLLCTLQL